MILDQQVVVQMAVHAPRVFAHEHKLGRPTYVCAERLVAVRTHQVFKRGVHLVAKLWISLVFIERELFYSLVSRCVLFVGLFLFFAVLLFFSFLIGRLWLSQQNG